MNLVPTSVLAATPPWALQAALTTSVRLRALGKKLGWLVALGRVLMALRFLRFAYWTVRDRTLMRHLRDVRNAFVVLVFKYAKRLPPVKARVDAEVKKNVSSMEKEFCTIDASKKAPRRFVELPAAALSDDEFTEELQRMHDLSTVDWKKGKVSGGAYHNSEALYRRMNDAYTTFMVNNPLHPDIFPATRVMEAQVIAMTLAMFHGSEASGHVGSVTSGGTESILMAVRAHAERGRRELGIATPEIVVPVTVHAAFDKACDYFCLRIVKVPVNQRTWKVDLRAFEAAITHNTVLLVGSAPNYPHGIIDDIGALGKLELKYRVGLHVDCCLGGFVVPFMDEAGFPLAPFDFRVPGVTSISADTHKYGFAPKGSSVVMYSNDELRRFQYFCAPDWPGGIYASPSVAGSRPGGLIAGAWAAMISMGRAGYVESCKKMVGGTRRIVSELRTIKGIEVMGDPLVSVIAVKSERFDIYRLSSALSARDWHAGNCQFPPCIHLTVTAVTDFDAFIRDVRECTEEIMRDPGAPTTGSAAIYGTSQEIPDRSLIDELTRRVLSVWTKV